MKTDYEIFEASSMKSRRMLREEELILQVAEELSRAMEKEGIRLRKVHGDKTVADVFKSVLEALND